MDNAYWKQKNKNIFLCKNKHFMGWATKGNF